MRRNRKSRNKLNRKMNTRGRSIRQKGSAENDTYVTKTEFEELRRSYQELQEQVQVLADRVPATKINTSDLLLLLGLYNRAIIPNYEEEVEVQGSNASRLLNLSIGATGGVSMFPSKPALLDTDSV